MPPIHPPAFQPNSDLASTLEAINNSLPLRKIEELLDGTDLSADAKSIVLDVARCTFVVGDQIIKLGRKLVSFAIELAKTIPNTLLGVALALVVTSLISGVPVLGALLAGLLKSILLIFGLTHGVLADMRTGEIGKRIENLITRLSPLENLTQ